jgi:hypothetical protein
MHCTAYFWLVSCLIYFSIVKIEAEYFSETSSDFYRSTRRYFSKGSNFRIRVRFQVRTSDLSLLHNMQTKPGDHTASYPVSTRGLIADVNVAGTTHICF